MEKFNWKDEAEKQWNKMAQSWHSKSRDMWETGSRKDILPFFQRQIPVGSKVADLGCGDGYASAKLASLGYNVTGADVSEEMLQKAKTSSGSLVEWVQSDISNLPFDKQLFDGVLAINSMEWTENPLLVLKEIHRILKKDGYACIGLLGPTAMPRNNSYSRLYGERVICNTMMPWELDRLASENGFTKIDEIGVYKKGTDHFPVDSLPLNLKQSLSFMWVFMLQKNE